MRTPLALLVPVLLVVGITVAAPASAQPPAPAKSAALAAVPTDSFAFFTVNVGKLHDTPGFKPLRDWLAAQKVGPTDDALGIPAGDIDRVTMFMPTASLLSPPVLLVTTRKPYNEARVLKALRADRGDKRDARRGNAIETGNDSFPVLVLVDDRTLMFLPKLGDRTVEFGGLIGQLIAKKADGPLAAALADADKHDIAFALDARPVAKLFGDELDRGLAPYVALFKVRTVMFAADFDKTARGSLRLSFADAADAKRAAPVLKEGLADLTATFEKEIARVGGRAEPAEKAFFETAITVLKAAKIESEGTNVFATAELPYADAVAKLAAALPKEYTAAVNSAKGQNNLKQLALGMYNFESAYGAFPGDVLPGDAPNARAWSWRVQILPFVEQENLYKQLDFTKAWNDPANLKKLEAMEMPKVFEIPGRPAPKGHTYFRVFTKPWNAKGNERPWLVEGLRGPRIAAITDGTSNTFMIVEAGEAVPWYKPDVLGYDGVLPLPQLGDKTADRFIASMADGSVRVLKPSKVGEKTLRALITLSGGEVIDLP
jgi:hypothetical protein